MSSKQNNSSIQINLGLCWTCDEKVATHKEFRDALGENELTCDACHREEYPEKYEVEENSLYVGNCMICSKKNDGDWDNNCEDPICIECENKMNCDGCGYSLFKAEFDSGKGRIMFNDLEEGKYMCGVCDDRVDDPQGMIPNEEDEE